MKSVKKFLCILIIVAIIISMLVVTASAGNIAYGVGTVTASWLNIRTGPGTSHSVTSMVQRDTRVVILEKTSSDWYHINYNGVVGYVASQYIANVGTVENFLATGKVTGSDVRMRSEPSTSCDTLGYYNAGTVMKVLGINDGWYKVQFGGNTGYMRSDYIDIISGYTVSVTPPPSGSDDGRRAVELALQYNGYNYVYGGASPSTGFDCSGFVYYIYGQLGYSLSRGATSQYNNNGYVVAMEDLQPGDLVFFAHDGPENGISHVGMYIGDGQFIHAGDTDSGVYISNLYSAHYQSVYYSAKRVV